MRVAFRADASVRIGTGHLMRCLALAEELAARDALVRFVCRELPDALAARIRAAGHELALLPPAAAPAAGGAEGGGLAHSAWLNATQGEDAAATDRALADVATWDWLVVDHYALDVRWERRLRARARHLLAIDDLADREHDVDALVDQGIQPARVDRYARLVPDRCRRLVGPAFALLRPEFRAARSADAPAAATRVELVVCFGGVDPAGMTSRVLDALAALPPERFAVNVVIGGANPHRERIGAQCRARANTKLFVDSSSVAALFRSADLGIGAGGITALERCCAGLPQVLVSIADNQREGSAGLARARVAIDLGQMERVTGEAVAAAVARLAERPRLRARMGRRAGALVDGRGAERVAVWMAREELRLSPARRSDSAEAWRWRNHPWTRRYMFDPSPIPLETHQGWWARALASEERSLVLVRSGPTGVGVLRFDHERDVSTISIYLDPALAGLGLGSAALRAGVRWIAAGGAGRRIRTLRAEVLPTNTSSQRSFAAAGFEPGSNAQEWILQVSE